METMSLKALAEKVLQRNSKGNLMETHGSHDGNFEGEKLSCRKPEYCTETKAVAEPSKEERATFEEAFTPKSAEAVNVLIETGKIEPALPCYICGEFAWWLSVYGVLVCGVCHPPVPATVKRWIGGPEAYGRMKASETAVVLSLDEIRERGAGERR